MSLSILNLPEETILDLLASLRSKAVKRRVYSVISHLTEDYWLSCDLQKYSESDAIEVSWFESISFLNWYAHNFKPRNYLEVGVRRGRSMAQVLVESPETQAYGFDMWIPDYACLEEQGIHTTNPGADFVLKELANLGVKKLPILTVGDSHQTLPAFFADPNNPQEFELINIDGDHTYEGAKLDLEIAFEHLAPGGAILFDDIYHQTHPELCGLWNEYKVKFDDYLFVEDPSGTGTGIAFKPPFTNLLDFLASDQSFTRYPKPTSSLNDLPIHFFTIVLNGEPFIRYHIDVFKHLPFKWHWHIVEGVAELKHDTAWSLGHGGSVTDSIHRNGRSNDGTTEYLDELLRLYPDQVTIYRKPDGVFWDGKREMVNAPLRSITEECLLWQIDADELWTLEQIVKTRQMFIDQPSKTAAYYWCWYFVGEKLVVSSRNCYTQNPNQEWLRTWRFRPGDVWAAHEPPKLVRPMFTGQWKDIATINPFSHQETEKQNLLFQHFAYVTDDQLRFKEQYYGYRGALSDWAKLQQQTEFPIFLRKYLSWVNDDTLIESAELCGVVPIAEKESHNQHWIFLPPEELEIKRMKIERPFPQVLIDGVFFQFTNSGIAQVWKSLLEEWVKTGFARHVVVLDRDGTAPRVPGIRYRPIRRYSYDTTGSDSAMLQEICDEKGADLFISTYYTAPLTTPSVFMAYDMIPEVIGANLNEGGWREKRYGIFHAIRYITISESTARDLCKIFPHIPEDAVTVAHCGVKPVFSPASAEEIDQFKAKFQVTKPYFLLVGERLGLNGYKNSILFFRALKRLSTQEKQEIAVVCVGGRNKLEPELAALADGIETHVYALDDADLRLAYSGAIAFVYPSLYEGFGLPILEAMACGCPVITCQNSSIPEVAGEAALYVKESLPDELVDALRKVRDPQMRQSLISTGLHQTQKFSWSKMADIVSNVLIQTGDQIKSEQGVPVSPVWMEFRKLQLQIQQAQAVQPQVAQQAQPQTAQISEQPVQSQLSQSNSTGQPRQVDWDTYNQLRQRFLKVKAKLEQAQARLSDAEGLIEAMRTSKFWKLRSGWFRLKKSLGLPVDN